MLLATMRANSPAMTIATPQATFLTPASSLDVQVRVSSSSGGMVGIVARSDALHRPPYRGVGVTPSSRETAAATLDFRLWPIVLKKSVIGGSCSRAVIAAASEPTATERGC